LQQVLDYPPLRAANQPLMLEIAETVDDQAGFVAELLATLLANQPDSDADAGHASGYAFGCRPVYLVATGATSFAALSAARGRIEDEVAYAALRGHVHVGRSIDGIDENQPSDAAYAPDIDDAAAAHFEFIQINLQRRNFKAAIDYTHQKKLSVIAKGGNNSYVSTLTCGWADAMSSRSWLDANRPTIQQSTMSVAVDLAHAQAGSKFTYRSPYGPRVVSVGDGSGSGMLPAFTSAAAGDQLLGSYLTFRADRAQSLPLGVVAEASGFSEICIAVAARFHHPNLGDGEHEVIVSIRDGMTGWALEHWGVGTDQELRYRVFTDDGKGGAVQEVVASTTAAALNADDGVYIWAIANFKVVGIGVQNMGPFLTFVQPPGQPYEISPNNHPITFGADPGQVTSTFDGDIQSFKLMY
jgi:hypothetical protein